MIRVEISYTTNPDEYPEHHGYYDTAEEAKEAIDEIFEMEEEERLKLVKENFSAGLDNLFKELAKKLSEEDEKAETDPNREEKSVPEIKQEEPTGKNAFSNFLNDFLKF